MIMSSRTAALISLLVAVVACDGSGEQTTSPNQTSETSLAQRLGFSEFAKTDGVGYTNFYIGKQVLEEVEDTGDFDPRPEVSYSMIRVPASVVDEIREPLTSRTLSLCETGSDVELFHNVAGDNYHADPPDSTNCTPWVTRYDGRMTIEYHSGQEGVYGFTQIGRLENGNLFASATMNGLLPDVCDGSVGQSSMYLGLLGSDVSPDDEIVQACQAPGWH